MWTEILIGVAALIGGGLAGYLITRTATKNTLKQAEEKGEAIKRNKLLEAKEKFLNMKAEFEKEVADRNAKIHAIETKAQQMESRIQQKEQSLNQKQNELQRRNSEIDAIKDNLDKQLQLVDAKKQELEKLHFQATENSLPYRVSPQNRLRLN